MKFKIHAMLDKIVVQNDDKREQHKRIQNELSVMLGNYGFTVYEKRQERMERNSCIIEMKESYYSEVSRLSYQGITLIFSFCDFDKFIFKAIYNTFGYLLTLTNDKKQWNINAEYDIVEKVQNAKYVSFRTSEETIWSYTNDGDIDIVDLLRYISCERIGFSAREEFVEFENELKVKKKYKNILQDEENYSRKKLPFIFDDVKHITYKGIKIEVPVNIDTIKELIEKSKQRKDLQLYIAESYKIQSERQFFDKELYSYTVIDENANLFYILEDSENPGTIYLYTDRIKEDELPRILLDREDWQKKGEIVKG